MSAKNRSMVCRVLPALLVVVAAAEVEGASFRFLMGWNDPEHSTGVCDVSADGTIGVGGTQQCCNSPRNLPRRWGGDGQWLSMGFFDGTALSVSGDGSVIVGQLGGHPFVVPVAPTAEAFRWTSDGGGVGLGYLTEDASYSSALAVSADGSSVVGRSTSDSGYRAFRWTQSEGMVSLGALPGHIASWAEGVSSDGSVIVGSSGTDSAAEAFRWTADGGMVGLGRLGDYLDSCAEDVSADGSVVVGWSGNPFHREPFPDPFRSFPMEEAEAFLWTEADGMVGLGYLPGHGYSRASDVSADGSIVVGTSYPFRYFGASPSPIPGEAFIWHADHGMRSLKDLLVTEYGLELPDGPLGYPAGISADGKVIVGNGGYGAWMVVIPEPSTIVLALTGLLGLLLYAWRRRRRASRALQCRPRPLRACSVLLALPLLLSVAEVEAARFHILGTRGGDGSTFVSGVSADGTTAVGFYYAGFGNMHPRRWSADGELLSTGNFKGAARSVSADGSVMIGEMGDAGFYSLPWYQPAFGEAFRWTSGGGSVGLGYLTEEVTRSFATAVSDDASTVVGRSDSDSGHRAFRWTQSEGMVGLGTLLGDHTSFAEGVSADGSVIVGSSSSDSANEAFRWTAGGMVGLGWLRDHLRSYAEDVSADGSVVVGYSGNRTRWAAYPLGSEPAEDYEAFVWTEADEMVGLGYLPGHGWSQAYAVSGDGSIVVGASAPVLYDGEYYSVGIREAFVWDADHGMQSLRDILVNEYQLELPDWFLGYPSGISADGKVIVGNDDYPGWKGAWMVVIPEPSSGVLALTGLFALLIYAWRKRRHAA